MASSSQQTQYQSLFRRETFPAITLQGKKYSLFHKFPRLFQWIIHNCCLLSLQVLVSVSETNPLIIYLRDVEKLLESERFYKLFQRLLNKISGPVLILGSRVLEPEDDCQEVTEGVSALFPYNIEIRPPEDESQLVSWKNRLEDDMKMIQFQDNKNHIAEVLAANDLQCDDLASICHADTMCLSNHIDEIVISAISYHLMHNKEPEYRNGKLVISSKR